MCFYYDDGPAKIWNEKVVKARKDHQCSECQCPIPKGAYYRNINFLWEDGWETCYLCARCNFVRHIIHQFELKEGCHDNESWPPVFDLSEAWMNGQYAQETGFLTESGRPVPLHELPVW